MKVEHAVLWIGFSVNDAIRLTTSTPLPVVPVRDHSRFNGGSFFSGSARNSFRATLSGGPSLARNSSRSTREERGAASVSEPEEEEEE